MKQCFLFALLLLSFGAAAQGSQQRNFPKADRQPRKAAASCPRVYLGLSTGINNNSGLLGANIDVAITDEFSLGGGAGLSSWGYKVYGEGRFYLSPCNRGWALAAAITRNTGSNNIKLSDVQTKYYGIADITIDQEAKTNAAISAYRFWTIGRRYSRMFLQLGWSVPLEPTSYRVRGGIELADESDQAIRMLSPGGLIIGFGLSFALHN